MSVPTVVCGTNWLVIGWQSSTSQAFNLTPYIIREGEDSLVVDEGFSSDESLFTYTIENVKLSLDNTKQTFSKTGAFPIIGSEIVQIKLLGVPIFMGYIDPSSIDKKAITDWVQRLDLVVVSPYNYLRQWMVGRRCDVIYNQSLFGAIADYRKFWARYVRTAQEVIERDANGRPTQDGWQDILVYMNPEVYHALGGFTSQPPLLTRARFEPKWCFDTDHLDTREDTPLSTIDPPLTAPVYQAWAEQDENGDTIKQWALVECAKRAESSVPRAVDIGKIIERLVWEYNNYMPSGVPESQGGLKNAPAMVLDEVTLSDILIARVIPLLDNLHHVELIVLPVGASTKVYVVSYPKTDWTGGTYSGDPHLYPTGACTIFEITNKTELTLIEADPNIPDFSDIGGNSGYQYGRVYGMPANYFAVFFLRETTQGAYGLYQYKAVIYSIDCSTNTLYTIELSTLHEDGLKSIYYSGGSFMWSTSLPHPPCFNTTYLGDTWYFDPASGGFAYSGNIFFDKVSLNFTDQSFADVFSSLGKLSNSVPYVHSSRTTQPLAMLEVHPRDYEAGSIAVPRSCLLDGGERWERKRYTLLEDTPEFDLEQINISKEHQDAIRKYYKDVFFKQEVNVGTFLIGYSDLPSIETLLSFRPFIRLYIGNIAAADYGIIQRVKFHEHHCEVVTRKVIG